MFKKMIEKLVGKPLVFLANIAEGTHEDGCITKLADATQTTKGKLVKIGSDVDHVAVTTADTEIPLGICDDEVDTVEDPVNVQILGQKKGTILARAHAAITMGDFVVPAADGRVQTMTGLTTVTTYIIGRALNTVTTQDDEVEIAHCVPVQRVIA